MLEKDRIKPGFRLLKRGTVRAVGVIWLGGPRFILGDILLGAIKHEREWCTDVLFFFFFPWKNSVIAVSSSQFFSTSCLFYGLEVTTLARFQGYLFVKLHSSIFKCCIYKKKTAKWNVMCLGELWYLLYHLIVLTSVSSTDQLWLIWS